MTQTPSRSADPDEPHVSPSTTPDGLSVADLPAPVRSVVVRWAADTLGQLLPAQTPNQLLRVARFTPAKRARLGAPALAGAIDSDAGFRAAVAERARSSRSSADERQDPAEAAAAAFLLRLPDEERLLAGIPREPEVADETVELRRTVRRLRRELERTAAERDQAKAQILARPEGSEEADKLRRRLREQGTRLRQAELAATETTERVESELGSLRAENIRLAAEVRNWQDRARSATERADRAQETLGRLREQTGQHKATADRRLDLLLSTVEGAVSGLRREWDLIGGGSDPADLVAGRLPGAVTAPESTAEPARLASWLALPAAHLIVDGYNVTKTGYPDLTLAQQRDRLVRQLAALSARTAAEVTIVFDGAAVAVPAPPGRGIRVLFSPPGVIADDVIRDLVAAEPLGRVVVVVSSDREVADGVRRRGARTAASTVLLALLA
ncbi:YacP-like NYN domain-containing protein [Nakamurella panacisegetis]|uniref:YacP-like NYN domain-containing protein n=1 Tax=Nakamurella panacisegetis TaxID=1090615 RepID=A0A1H0R228_9ACTN|nr:NYN domain-containing protein [Nakamurella panacisegetis]SDP23591.1 YacP-like NYN domain-containing protein [Nakamurella panacisegetis]